MNNMNKKQPYSIYTHNQAGTTMYYLGLFNNEFDAFDFAMINYKWFANEPDIDSIVITE